MNRYPDLALTVACLLGVAAVIVLARWSMNPHRERAVRRAMLPRVPAGVQAWN